mgnify:CR=1 FL=1
MVRLPEDTIKEKIILLLILSITVFVGCAAPGTPLIRTTQHDGEGPLIAECKNVSNKDRIEVFNVHSYLTTWGSALKEGAIEGFREGLQNAEDEAKITVESIKLAEKLAVELSDTFSRKERRDQLQSSPEPDWTEEKNELPSKAIPFCRKYPANSSAIFTAAKTVLGTLDHQISKIDEELGFLETEFVERSHPGARWRDKYVIYIDANPDELDHSVVKIFRTVYIDRSGNTFNEAESVGHNETYILTRIADLLEERK